MEDNKEVTKLTMSAEKGKMGRSGTEIKRLKIQ